MLSNHLRLSQLIFKPTSSHRICFNQLKNLRNVNSLTSSILPTVSSLSLSRSLKNLPLSSTFSTTATNNWKSIGKKTRKLRYKLKTHQGAKKRFFLTGRGQFKRSQSGKQHLMTGLSRQHKRRLKPMVIVNQTHSNLLRKLLPYTKRAGFRKLNEKETVWWKTSSLQKSGHALNQAIKRSNQFKNLTN
ncbi:hypothetical protein O181_005160 [Austropuccinia psidii MF-1]|uniref:50S ribosomal protein L35 n=1 Tax=Austropuccinia psidii MF-1 TaxID=1389203 RepID=A0A9Q3GFK0_9BASI|nr:hypothetical protein [Austropuccinia psidii MF-1]